jgi:hypothetical protein
LILRHTLFKKVGLPLQTNHIHPCDDWGEEREREKVQEVCKPPSHLQALNSQQQLALTIKRIFGSKEWAVSQIP